MNLYSTSLDVSRKNVAHSDPDAVGVSDEIITKEFVLLELLYKPLVLPEIKIRVFTSPILFLSSAPKSTFCSSLKPLKHYLRG